MPAAVLLALAAVVALYSPTPARADGLPASQMQLTTASDTVTFGAQVRLRGRLILAYGAAASRVPVVLSSRVAGQESFTVLRTVWPDTYGRFVIRAMPFQTTTFRVEVGVEGAGQTVPPVSAEIVVAVRPRILFGLRSRVWAGEAVTFRGEVLPRQSAGVIVQVQRRLSGTWRTVAGAVTDGSSRFSVVWTPPRDGRAVFRAVVPGDGARLRGVSRRRTRLIRDPDPHGVPRAFKRLIVIDHAAYRLYYYEHGRVVRDFPCVLGKPSTPTPLGKGFRIRRKLMEPGGANGARYMGYLGHIGIHGTNQPWLLRRFPRAFSHGCTRLYDRHAIWLYERVPIGTRVWNVRGTLTRTGGEAMTR